MVVIDAIYRPLTLSLWFDKLTMSDLLITLTPFASLRAGSEPVEGQAHHERNNGHQSQKTLLIELMKEVC